MEADGYLAALETEGAAFLAAVEGNLRAPVTACPGWDVADLTYHLGEVHRFWGRIVADRVIDRESAAIGDPARPDEEDLAAWYRDGLLELLATLRSADPATEVWTWAPQHDVAFVQRRMAQETAVHRWDAERAADRAGPIGRKLAVDGIDEFLDFFLDDGPEGIDPGTASLHLHATDGEGEWLVQAGADGFDVRRGHEKGDAALRGPASDLLLALWRRVDLDALDVVGERAAAEAVLGYPNLE